MKIIPNCTSLSGIFFRKPPPKKHPRHRAVLKTWRGCFSQISPFCISGGGFLQKIHLSETSLSCVVKFLYALLVATDLGDQKYFLILASFLKTSQCKKDSLYFDYVITHPDKQLKGQIMSQQS